MFNYGLNREMHNIAMHLDTTPVKLGKYNLRTHLRFMENIGLISEINKKDFAVIVEILIDLTERFYSKGNATLLTRAIVNFIVLMGRSDKRFNSRFAHKIKEPDLKSVIVSTIHNGANSYNIIKMISSIGKYVSINTGKYSLNIHTVDIAHSFAKELLHLMDTCNKYLIVVVEKLQSIELNNGTHFSSTIAYDLLWYSRGYKHLKPSVFVDYIEYPKAGILHLEDIGQIY